MGVLQVINKLKQLAADPENRVGIVRDQGMLPTLLVFLENGDATAVSGALDVLAALADEPACRAPMRAEPGLLDKLRDIAAKASAAPLADADPAATTARSVVAVLDNAAEAQTNTSANVTNTQKNAAAFSTPQKPVIEVVDIGAIFAKPADTKQSKIHNYTLFVKGLHGEVQRDAVEQKLLQVTGVLSFWFDIYQQKAEIRARIEEKVIIAAIKEAGFTAVAWRGDGSPHAQGKKSSDASEADYLDENEAPNHSYGSGGWLGTLAIFGAKDSKKKESSEGLFGKLTSSWW